MKPLRPIEHILMDLLSALTRQGTEQDGNWGWPSSRQTFAELYDELLKRTDAAQLRAQEGDDGR